MVFPASYFQTDSIAHDLEQFAVRLDPVRGGPNPSANRQANEKKKDEQMGTENCHGAEKIKQARIPSILFFP